MSIITSFLEALALVNGPLTLIAFIVVALLAMLMLVLKHTNGLEKTQELIGAGHLLEKGEFTKIFNATLYTVLAVAAMFFSLLAYNFYINLEQSRPPAGVACFANSCTGLDAQEVGCSANAGTMTKTFVSYPKYGSKYKNIELQLRHSIVCNASWAKADAPVGSRLFVEDEQGNQYKPLIIRDFGFPGPYYTDMVSGTVSRRACIEDSEGDKQCTSFVHGKKRY